MLCFIIIDVVIPIYFHSYLCWVLLLILCLLLIFIHISLHSVTLATLQNF